MEGFQPSFMEEVDNMTWDQLGFQSEEDAFNMSKLLSPPPEVPVNQGSISCNDQGGQNNVINDSIQQTTPFSTSFPETMPGHGYMTPNTTTSQHGGFNQPGPSFPPPRDQQWTDYQSPMSNQVPAMLPGPQPPMNQWHQNSFIHQPQPGHGYMTPNATTSQHGGFNQSGPSSPAPRIQTFSNEGQVDQAAVIPNIDNMQEENFVPGSQMDNLQVRGLQNQSARPNASNPGPDTSLQSQIRGLNTQQVKTVGSKYPFRIHVEYKADGSMKCKFCQHTWANKTSISRFKWHLSGEEGHDVAICREVTKEVQEAAFLAMCGGHKRQKITASAVNVNDCGISTCLQEQNIENENTGGGIGRVQREVQVVEPGVVEERISSHAIAGNDVVSMTGMRGQEDRVSEGALESRLRIEPVDRALEQSNAVLGNMAGGAGRIHVGVQGMEQGPVENRFSRIYKRKMAWKTLVKDLFSMMHLRMYLEQSKCSFWSLKEIHPNFVLTLEDVMINLVLHQ